jgi:hypothetical protein
MCIYVYVYIYIYIYIYMILNRYQGGLDKLVATNAMVNELQNEIIKLQPVLQTAAKETSELIQIVTKDKEAAAVVQANVEEEAKKVIYMPTCRILCRDLGRIEVVPQNCRNVLR